MKTLYIDVYFLINFTVDIISLCFAGMLSKIVTSFGRIISAALIGAAFATGVIFLQDNFILKLFLSFLILVIIGVISTGSININRKIKFIISFCIFEALVGGIITMIWGFLDTYLYGYVSSESNIYVNRKMLIFALIILLVIGVFRMIVSAFNSNCSEKTVEIEISFMNRTIKTESLVDSGNLATDPMNMCPVLFLKAKTAMQIFPKNVVDLLDPDNIDREIRKRIRLIPISSGSNRRVLIGVKPDSVRIFSNGKSEPIKVTIAIDKEEGSYGGYDSLMPASALDNVIF